MGQLAASELEGAARADQAFRASDWGAAEAAYAGLIRASPESGLFHFRRGAALVHLGRPAEALPVLEKAESLGWPAVQVAFRKACAQARLGL
jgi:predicted Zn-dependent protease